MLIIVINIIKIYNVISILFIDYKQILESPTLKTTLPQNYIIDIYTNQISQYLKMPNKVHSSLDGNKGNLHADLSPSQKVHFFQAYKQDYLC